MEVGREIFIIKEGGLNLFGENNLRKSKLPCSDSPQISSMNEVKTYSLYVHSYIFFFSMFS